jgi:putative chitinase
MILKNGSTGENVKQLQTKLNLAADGVYGPNTESKVKEWQAANGLPVDGVIGDDDWNKMFTVNINLEKLKGHIPDSVIAQIPNTAIKFGISNSLRLAHFLAQCSKESNNFQNVFENLNYSADRLIVIFKNYFNANTAALYAYNSEKIGSKVYGSRLGNGDEASKEGFKFRGRGYIQLTGKSNYTEFTKFIGEDCISNPDLVATKYPLASAAFFFKVNNLWSICDKGATDEIVTAVTKRVNGGILGLTDRIKYFKEYHSLLG